MTTREANRNEFPFMVDIMVDNHYRGNGILISPRFVLTSAALLNGSSFAVLTFGVHDTLEYRVSGNQTEVDAVEVRVDGNVILHSSWNPNGFDNNLALIVLNSELALSPAIQPINTLDSTQNWVGQTAKGVGWGLHTDKNNVTKYTVTPQVVDLSMISMQEANAELGNFDQTQHVAATGETYSTAALVTTGSDGTKLVGFLNQSQIGNGFAVHGVAVYSRLDQFADWIANNSGIYFN